MLFKFGGTVMIKKVDISQFGSFQNFNWDTVMEEFHQRNIIYGRNYSGKTTLSRVFQCLEKGKMHESFKEGNFHFYFENGNTINESQLSRKKANIRVYNSDFKRENLSILHDENGEVKPFAIIGEKNIDIEKSIKKNREEIKNTEDEIGSKDKNTGLLGEYNQLYKKNDLLNKNLSSKLTEKAREIRGNINLFRITESFKTYNRRNLDTEIPLASKLTEEDKERYLAIIKDEPKDIIKVNRPNLLDFSKLKLQTEELLVKEVKPSNSIEYLLENNVLQNWVEEGIKLHKDKRNTCAFCSNPIDSELWEALDAHFTKESEDYKDELNALARKIENEMKSLKSYQLEQKEKFYTKFQEKYDQISKDWDKVRDSYNINLNVLLDSINRQIDSLFSDINTREIELINIRNGYNEIFQKYQSLVQENNEYTQSLGEEQDKAREKLRLNFIYVALNDINYEDTLKEMKDLEGPKIEKKKELDEARYRLEVLKKQEEDLIAQLNDQEAAASKVNYYLKNQLGHNELELSAIEKETNDIEKLSLKKYQFRIMRDGEPAYNLSEGEQSLISFCYFLATLKSIENPEEWILFIDDPISSLDGNNIFYIYSLIDSEIAQVKYKQIFISTHNLDLLKYLYRLEKPTNNKKKWVQKYFMLEKKIKGSNIIEMPEFLSKYSTEFIYLFNEIYKVGIEKQSDENLSAFYNFPNNARKFLESYLFFKFPDSTIGNKKRLEYFFNDVTSVSFLQRIHNEFSHGEEQPDRLHKPIDIEEFKKDALIILGEIYDRDEEQFQSLCNSIGVELESLTSQLLMNLSMVGLAEE